jgi:hypothetical protein
MPGDGKEVHIDHKAHQKDNSNVVEVPGEKVPWKEQVIGAFFEPNLPSCVC